jgi:F-type H+-transporting ATPase subunit b
MDINIVQILFQLINFSVVVGAVSYLLYKPVLKILEERTSRIEQAQKAAQETLEEKERINKLEKAVIKAADKKAAEIVDAARQTAKEIEAAAVIKAKSQANKEIEKARLDWESEKSQLIQEIQSEYVASVIATAGKVLAADLDSKKHTALIDSQLTDLLKKI